MSRFNFSFFTILALTCACACLNAARIQDLTQIKGARSNQLFGYGVVTGLAGQGDSRSALQFENLMMTRAYLCKILHFTSVGRACGVP